MGESFSSWVKYKEQESWGRLGICVSLCLPGKADSSEVWVEAVTTVGQAPDFIIEIALFLDLCLRVFHGSGTVLAETEAQVVLKVGLEFRLC